MLNKIGTYFDTMGVNKIVRKTNVKCILKITLEKNILFIYNDISKVIKYL